jgi:hypothetical protein
MDVAVDEGMEKKDEKGDSKPAPTLLPEIKKAQKDFGRESDSRRRVADQVYALARVALSNVRCEAQPGPAIMGE